jgi:hypothetical protein
VAGFSGSKIFRMNNNGSLILDTLILQPDVSVLTLVSHDGGFITLSSGLVLAKTDGNLFLKGLAVKSAGASTGIIGVSYKVRNIETGIELQYSRDYGLNWQTITNNLNPDSTNFLSSFPVFEQDSILVRLNSPDRISLDYSFDYSMGMQCDSIGVNRVSMWISSFGFGSHDPRTGGPGFFWPDHSKTAIFMDGLVWGGKVNGEIRANGNNHRNGIRPGIILPNGKPDDPEKSKYNIRKLKYNWKNLPPGPEKEKYQIINDTWPVELGAPFKDLDYDGAYTPGVDEAGIGDETLFYVANDMDTNYCRYVYGSDPIGLEFQTTTFGFLQDNPLKDVVYKKYVIINRSNNVIEDMYLAYWSDPDLGNGSDDYAGVDSLLNLAYCYNAVNNDYIYGSPAPAVGYILIHGPITNGNPGDSAMFNGKWIKGKKNLNLSSFYSYTWFDMPDPQAGVYAGTLELYNNFRGLYFDGTPIINPVTAAPTKFVTPGNPYTGSGWYEGSGWPGGPPSGDRRFIMTSGPFTMAAGDTQEIVIAIAAALGTTHLQSIEVLKNTTGAADSYYKTLFTTISGGIDKNIPDEFSLDQNYPNPFNNYTVIKFTLPSRKFVNLSVYDITGRRIAELINNEIDAGKHEARFNNAALASGVYFYRITAGEHHSVRKMLLLK